MNELTHMLQNVKSEKALQLLKAVVALMVAALLALTPGLAFATAGVEDFPDPSAVASEVNDETTDMVDLDESDDQDTGLMGDELSSSEQRALDANSSISTASIEDPDAPDPGEDDDDPDAIWKTDLDTRICGIGADYTQFEGLSDYEKALKAHECLLSFPTSHFVPGATLPEGMTVLGGIFLDEVGSASYHAAFAYYLTKLGIDEQNVLQQESDGHVWTLVKLDNEWTHIDVAYDQALARESLGYLCFGLTDDQISLAHPQYKNETGNAAVGLSNNYYHAYYETTHEVMGVTVDKIDIIRNAISAAFPSGITTAVLPVPILSTDPVVGDKEFKKLLYSQIAQCLDGDFIDDGKKNRANVTYLPNGTSEATAETLGYEPDPLGGAFSVTIVKSIANATVTNVNKEVSYTGKEIKQNPKVALGGVLKEGTDYKVTYENNSNPGTATMIITGLGVYANTEQRINFKIVPAKISNSDITVSRMQSVIPYTGSAITQNDIIVTHKTNGILIKDQNYKISYQNNKGPGVATLIITGVGKYTGTAKVTFTIEKKSNGSSNNSSNGSTNTNSSNNGATSVVTQSAPTAPKVTGTWKKSKSKWWFKLDAKSQATLKSSKNYPYNRWVTIDGKRYYFDKAGWMKTSWLSYNSKWYYLGSDGAMKTGWKKTGGKWYYLHTDGIMQTGKKIINGKTYFLNTSSGAMKTGWNKESGKWYHYGSSGAMTQGWLKSGGKWYFMDTSSGAMKTAWVDTGGKRYFMHPSNGDMLTGWNKITTTASGKAVSNFYYFDKSGVMQKNKWIGNYYVESDGKMATGKWIGKYHVNANGLWDATKK